MSVVTRKRVRGGDVPKPTIQPEPTRSDPFRGYRHPNRPRRLLVVGDATPLSTTAVSRGREIFPACVVPAAPAHRKARRSSSSLTVIVIACFGKDSVS